MALYLLHAGLQGNLRDLAEFRAWGGKLWWTAAVAPALWYGTSVIVLHGPRGAVPTWYRQRIAYPLGGFIALAAVFFVVSSVTGDLVLKWSEPEALSKPAQISASWRNLPGPLFSWFAPFVVVCIVVPFGHLAWGWRRVLRETRSRPQLHWLTVSAALFVASGSWLVTNVLVGYLPYIFGWLEPGLGLLTAGLGILAWTVVRHGTWVEGKPVRDDFLYFLAGLGVVVGIYMAIVALIFWAGMPLSVWTLLLMCVLGLLVITAHTLADLGRVTLGRLFFPDAWQILAGFLRYAEQTPRAHDPAIVLRQATEDTEQQWWYLQTERALRQLRSPGELAQLAVLPLLAPEGISPLDRARALRRLVVASISKLQSGYDGPPPQPYVILKEHYVEDRPTKAIMSEHRIPEKTYYSERKKGVAAVAAELQALAEAAQHREQVRQALAQQELARARQIQEGLLRLVDEIPVGVEVDAVCLPAADIGGDFYDVVALGNSRLAVVVGDVSGHGIDAALLAATTRSELRAALAQHRALAAALTTVNRTLCRADASGMFAAVVGLVLDTQTGRGEVVAAANPAPLLRRGEGPVAAVETAGPRLPLGSMSGLTYEASEVQLGVGDQLLLYTDGVVETEGAKAGEDGLFGFDRLEALAAELPGENAAGLVSGVLRAVEAHRVGEQQDDVTILALRRASIPADASPGMDTVGAGV